MIIPIYSDELFELITLAEIDASFLEAGRVYRMLPELEPMEVVLPPDEVAEFTELEIIDVRLDQFHRRLPGSTVLTSRIQSTWLGFALCPDELALKIRAAFAPGQQSWALNELRWMAWRLER